MKYSKIDIDRMREVFYADFDAGVLFRRKSYPAIKAGVPVGGANTSGHLQTEVDGKAYLVHRIIWCLFYGKNPENQIDHINRVKSDNRICNLRDVPHFANIQNRPARKTNKLGIHGVHFCETWKRYKAQIAHNGKKMHIGYYDSAQEAHSAYMEKKLQLHKFYVEIEGEA